MPHLAWGHASSWYAIPTRATRRVAPTGILYSALSTQHSALSTQHSVLGTRYSRLGTRRGFAAFFLEPIFPLGVVRRSPGVRDGPRAAPYYLGQPFYLEGVLGDGEALPELGGGRLKHLREPLRHHRDAFHAAGGAAQHGQRVQ